MVAAIATAAALAAGTAGLAIAGTPAKASPAAAPQSPARYQGPRLKMIAAQNQLTVYGFPAKKGSKKLQVFVDPGIWLASLGSALQFNVGRTSYAKPLTLTQVISRPGGAKVTRRLPADMLDYWNGIYGMVRITVRDGGKVVTSYRLTVCPDSFDSERATPDSPATSPYPQNGCGTFDPFPLGQVWGIAKGWAIDPAEGGFPGQLVLLNPNRSYTVTESITSRYTHWLGVAPGDSSASIKMTVLPQPGFPPPPPPSPSPTPTATVTATSSPSPQPTLTLSASASAPAAAAPAGPGMFTLPVPPYKPRRNPATTRTVPLPALPAVPDLKNPPAAALPDLSPLPAWGMSVAHTGARNTVGHDYLNFAATVWVGGNSPLDVEGFRSNGSPVMKAWQYFYENGKVIGRAPAGTMGFDKAKGHTHWHFQQFAQYRLLTAGKKLAVRSQKVGFCIAPTDAVDMLLRHALWNPYYIGFGGQCGSPTALWVREMMPIGWGDTYQQFLAGQAFDITNLPNGTYYVEVIANPEHVLKETRYRNDISLRKVILTGTKGHRHMIVPAYDGIDPERG